MCVSSRSKYLSRQGDVGLTVSFFCSYMQQDWMFLEHTKYCFLSSRIVRLTQEQHESNAVCTHGGLNS